MLSKKTTSIGIIGIGYVGLPLAVEFGKLFKTIAYDINKSRVHQLMEGLDDTLEISKQQLRQSKNLIFSTDTKHLKQCNIYIITVPTPIFKNKKPDLRFLKDASKLVGKIINNQDIIIYESTVYPGATEEICIPILEKYSKLNFLNKDNCTKVSKGFYCGYSPERINTGDKKHNLTNIKKITSGSTPYASKKIDQLYKLIIKAGTHLTNNIIEAEAAKIIENTQRDINIALINELAIIFNKLNIDTNEVLKAAGTKWNFMPFKPGLVGGHCIGVDPYYLTYQSIKKGYLPKVILSGRRINNHMGIYVSDRIKKLMKSKGIKIKGSNVLVMGYTFKENCTDIRNTRVADILKNLSNSNCNIDVYDPWVNRNEFKKSKKINLIKSPKKNTYEAIVLAVAHDIFKKLSKNIILKYTKKNKIIYDIQNILPVEIVDERL